MRHYHAALWIRGSDGREHAIHFIGADDAPHRLIRWIIGELTRRGFTLRASEWRSGDRDAPYQYRSDPDPTDWDEMPF